MAAYQCRLADVLLDHRPFRQVKVFELVADYNPFAETSSNSLLDEPLTLWRIGTNSVGARVRSEVFCHLGAFVRQHKPKRSPGMVVHF